MAIWTKGVSWSKFKEALTCERQLQFDLEKVPPSSIGRGWYQGLGKAVQKVFELYYNQDLWKSEKTSTEDVFREITRRVLLKKEFYDEGIIFDDNLSKERLEKEIVEQVLSGRKLMAEAGLLQVKLKSEQGWGATFRNLRLYGMIDFIKENGGNHVSIYDGKGSQEQNADERQLVYYALVLLNSDKVVDEAALLYWKHGYVKVDVSMERVREFIETDYARGAEVFQRLKSGQADMPANPSPKECGWCNWKISCKDSVYYRPDFKQDGYVSLEELSGN